MAQKLFQAARIRPTAELELAFENGYMDGFKKRIIGSDLKK